MAQLSRPYQIGLVAVALLAAVWLLLVQGHSSSPSATVPQVSSTAGAVRTVKAPVAASKPAAHAAKGTPGSASPIYHGAAPGVEGLTKAIAKANNAVAVSKANAAQLEQKSAQASSPSAGATTTSAAATPSTTAAATPSKTSTAATKTSAPTAPKTSTSSGAATRNTSVARQHSVEAQLAKGKVALILFWDPKGADDVAVHDAVKALRGQSGLGIAIDEASAADVASFGTITRGVQVYGTPTLLIVGKGGKTRTLTGLLDDFSIKQAILEIKQS
jgi:hypothetical protein